MANYSFRNLILAGATLCLLVPFLLLSWLNYRSSRQWARAEIVESALPLTRDNIYSEIHADLMQPLYVSSTMAHDAFLKEWTRGGEEDVDRVVRYLDAIHRKYGYFSVFFVSASTHRYYHYRGLHKVIRPDDDHDDWFYDFVEYGGEYRLEVDTDEAGNNALTIFINFRVEDEAGELLGVTGVGMKMETVARLLESTRVKYDREVYLVNRRGEVQAHVDESLIRRAGLKEMPGLAEHAEEILSSLDEVVNLSYDGPGGRAYLTARYMPELDWFLVVEQDESVALANARANFYRTLAFGVLIWAALLALLLWAAGRSRQRLERIARTDPLTDLGNRRRFEEEFAVACARHQRQGDPFSLAVLDLDGFKAVNDTLGHSAGDKLLQACAEAMRNVVRPTDHLARWGGDEFILLASCPAGEMSHLADRLREAVKSAAHALAADEAADPRRGVTVSLGVVAYRAGATLDELTAQADALLYRCKEAGGDQVLFGVSGEDASGAHGE
jgi:diguanylate cyclase (GGDEF)-like protein